MTIQDNRRAAVLLELSGALSKVFSCGYADLPKEARAAIIEKLDQGCRVEFAVRMAPLHVRCYVARPDLEERVLLFEVETGLDAAELH